MVKVVSAPLVSVRT